MDEISNTHKIVSYIDQPAFCVTDGIVTAANEGALHRGIETGCAISSMLVQHRDAYEAFDGGILYLTLEAQGAEYHAAVTRTQTEDVFVLDCRFADDALQALSLASQHLRTELGSVMVSAQKNDPDGSVMRGLYRMQRMLCNMSDIPIIRNKKSPAYMLELGSAVYEITEKAATMLDAADIRVMYNGEQALVHTLADYELLERALLNLISNAAKFSGKGSEITVALSHKKSIATITVEDSGSGICSSLYRTLFTRYLREPSIEDGHRGIGLGMALVQSVAAHHGGTVLVSQGRNGGTKVALSIAVRELDEPVLRSPRVLLADYAGNMDHTLLELSDVLPAKLYKPE